MEDKLFDSEEKQQAAIATFVTGMNTPFWQLMVQILEANIKVVTEQILSGGEKEQMDRLRDRLRIHKELIDTPGRMIEKLSSVEGEEPDLDPFQTISQLKEERKKASA